MRLGTRSWTFIKKNCLPIWRPKAAGREKITFHVAWRAAIGATSPREAAMAKMTATETAQGVIDRAPPDVRRSWRRGQIIERL